MLLVLLLFACGGDTPSEDVQITDGITGEEVDPDTVPDEIIEGVKDVAETQSKGLEGAGVEVHRAWNYDGPSLIQPIEGAKLVAAEVSFSGEMTGFDLDDVDIIDAKTGTNYGSNPQIECFLPDGSERIPCFDKERPEDPDVIRVGLVWAVPAETAVVKLGYWGSEIAGPVELAASGPSYPDQQESPVGKVSWSDGDVEHITVALDLKHYPRTGRADRLVLVCEEEKEGRTWRVRADAAVILDDGAPRDEDRTSWPYYLESARALADYRVPEGCTPSGFQRWGDPVEIPKAEVEPPTETIRDWLERHPAPLSARSR